MVLANEVINLMNEVAGVPLDLAKHKTSQTVFYKDGHQLAGLTGIVINVYPDRQTVDLKIGRATRVDVPVADLMAYDDSGAAAGNPERDGKSHI